MHGYPNMQKKANRPKDITSTAGFEPAREFPYDFESYALTARPC